MIEITRWATFASPLLIIIAFKNQGHDTTEDLTIQLWFLPYLYLKAKRIMNSTFCCMISCPFSNCPVQIWSVNGKKILRCHYGCTRDYSKCVEVVFSATVSATCDQSPLPFFLHSYEKIFCIHKPSTVVVEYQDYFQSQEFRRICLVFFSRKN